MPCSTGVETGPGALPLLRTGLMCIQKETSVNAGDNYCVCLPVFHEEGKRRTTTIALVMRCEYCFVLVTWADSVQ